MPRRYTEIRFHGRAGQGIVTASAILSHAFFYEGKYPQSVPLYGPQRRGAPVTVFLRVGEEKILRRSWVYNPQVVVVLDDSLIKMADVSSGMPEGGLVLVNTASPEGNGFGFRDDLQVAGVDADEIAYRLELGGPPYPHINTLMLAAFCKLTGLVSLEAVRRAAQERFPSDDDRVERGMREAYERASFL